MCLCVDGKLYFSACGSAGQRPRWSLQNVWLKSRDWRRTRFQSEPWSEWVISACLLSVFVSVWERERERETETDGTDVPWHETVNPLNPGSCWCRTKVLLCVLSAIKSYWTSDSQPLFIFSLWRPVLSVLSNSRLPIMSELRSSAIIYWGNEVENSKLLWNPTLLWTP